MSDHRVLAINYIIIIQKSHIFLLPFYSVSLNKVFFFNRHAKIKQDAVTWTLPFTYNSKKMLKTFTPGNYMLPLVLMVRPNTNKSTFV